MSQSESNLDRQRKRHAGPLIGMAAVLVFVAGALVWWAYDAASPTDVGVRPDSASAPAEVLQEDGNAAPVEAPQNAIEQTQGVDN